MRLTSLLYFGSKHSIQSVRVDQAFKASVWELSFAFMSIYKFKSIDKLPYIVALGKTLCEIFLFLCDTPVVKLSN